MDVDCHENGTFEWVKHGPIISKTLFVHYFHVL